jgi:hypothetical protein
MRFHPFRRLWATPIGPPAEGRARTAADHQPDEPASPERQLAGETEAFLDGTLAELVAGRLRTLPPWMLVNRIAHGDIDELRGLVQGDTAPLTIVGAPAAYNRTWAMAQRSLVLHLLASGRAPDEIRRVQREVLVPLELQLITRSTTASLTLGSIVIEAVDALDQHRLDH